MNKVTDIFGLDIPNNQKNNRPFIIIHSREPSKIIEKVANEAVSIWRLRYNTIMHTLYSNHIDPSKYSPLGHLWISHNETVKKISIILVNTDNTISKYPIDWVRIGQFGHTFIWKPIADHGFVPLGFVASSTKPSLRLIRTVNGHLTRNLDKHSNGQKTFAQNEFDLLGYIKQPMYTIKRTAMLKDNNLIKLLSQKGNYISEENGLIQMKRFNPKSIKYTGDGQMKINDRCMSVQSDGRVGLDQCNSSDSQKWFPYEDHYISQQTNNCLSDDKELRVNECNSTDDKQIWSTQESDWDPEVGDSFALVESDEPWYKELKNDGISVNGYQNYAKYKSNLQLDMTKDDLGYGHSYASRAGIEGFDEGLGSSFNLIACTLVLIVFILVCVRFALNSK